MRGLLNNLAGKHSFLRGFIKIRIKADQFQIHLFCCHVLIGIIKIQGIILYRFNNFEMVIILQTDDIDGRFINEIENKRKGARLIKTISLKGDSAKRLTFYGSGF